VWSMFPMINAGPRLTWTNFNQLKEKIPLLQLKLRLPYRALQVLAVLSTSARRASAECGVDIYVALVVGACVRR
jgi:hypothetical protein